MCVSLDGRGSAVMAIVVNVDGILAVGGKEKCG